MPASPWYGFNYMWNPFKHFSEIDIRLKEYYVWKTETKSISVALDHKEPIVKFITLNHITSPDQIVIEHVHDFKSWVLDHYASDYTIEKNMKPIRCFLRFCQRYDIIGQMNKLGRKPNLEMIKQVKEYRKKKITYRDLQKILEGKYGRDFNLKTLNFWGNYKLK